jgi:hypothetical protein
VLFLTDAYGQASADAPTNINELRRRIDQLAEKYEQRCESNGTKTEKDLLLIERGAVLEGGLAVPITTQIVSVLRSLKKEITDGYCERAEEYRDITKIIGQGAN